MGGKSPHKIVNFLRIFEFGKPKEFQHTSNEEWYERLYPHYAESSIISLNEGFFISLRGKSPKDTIKEIAHSIGYQTNMLQEHSEALEKSKHLKSSSYSVGKKKYSEIEKKYKEQKNKIDSLQKKLISSGELMSIQKYFGFELIYIPWYVARLDKPNSHRYIVIDHLGKIDDYFSNLITHDDHIYDSLLENTEQNSAEDFQGSSQDEYRQDYNQNNNHDYNQNNKSDDEQKNHRTVLDESELTESKCYEILNVNQNASAQQIEDSYAVLQKQYHPDKHLGEKRKDFAEAEMEEIHMAYNKLKELGKV